MTRSSTGERRTLLDRARGVLVLAVVAGHSVAIVGVPTGPIEYFLAAAYLIRMPALFLISGALLSFRPLAAELRAILARLAPAYLVGVGVAILVTLFMSGDLALRIFPPPWALWFLLTLATLRTATSLFPNRNLALALALMAALIASVIQLPGYLSLHRTASFAPFFVFGVWFGAARLEAVALQIGFVRGAALVAASLLAGVAVISLPELPRTVLEWRNPLTEYGHSPLFAALASTALHLAALAGSLGVIAIIARVRSSRWLEWCGKESLAIYLGHVAIFTMIRAAPQSDSLHDETRLLASIGLTLVGVLLPIAALLCTRWLRRTVNARRARV